MGGSESKSSSSQKQSTKVTNSSKLKVMNENINKTMVNTIIKNSQTCASKIINDQKLIISNIDVSGDININANQMQQAYLNFSCLQNADVQSAIVTDITNSVLNQINNTYDTNVLQQFNSTLKANSKNGFLNTPFTKSSSDTNSKQESKVKISNDINQNLKNVVKNLVDVSFNSETINELISKMQQAQYVRVSNLSGASFTFTVNQDQTAKVLLKSIQESGVASEVTSRLMTTLDVQVKNDIGTSTDTSQTSSGTSTAENSGPFESLGSLLTAPLNSLLSGFGLDGLSNSMGSFVTSCISCIICICCLIIIFSIVGFVFK